MKKTKTILLLLLIGFTASGQIIKKKQISEKFIIGYTTTGFGVNYKDSITYEKQNIINIYVGPYVGYFFNRNFGIGIMGGYEFIRGNLVPHEDFYELGGFARYYIPHKINLTYLNYILFIS